MVAYIRVHLCPALDVRRLHHLGLSWQTHHRRVRLQAARSKLRRRIGSGDQCYQHVVLDHLDVHCAVWSPQLASNSGQEDGGSEGAGW